MSGKEARSTHRLARVLPGALLALALTTQAPATEAAWVNVALANGQVTLILGTAPNPVATAAPVSVNFNLTAAQVGNGIAVSGTPDVEVQFGVRRFWFLAPSQADLVITSPASLNSGSNQIPISDISWTTAAASGTPGGTQLIAGGTLATGAQTIHTLNPPSVFLTATTVWAGGVFTFRFANTQVYPQGTYGPATITFTASRN